MKNSGYKIVYVPNAIIWHKNAGSTGGSGSTLQDYFITRNRLLLGITYASFRTKVALIRESMQILFNGRPYQKKAILDYYRQNYNKGSFFK